MQSTRHLHFGLVMILDLQYIYFDLFYSVGFYFVNAWLVHMFFVVVVIVHFVVVVEAAADAVWNPGTKPGSTPTETTTGSPAVGGGVDGTGGRLF